MNNRYSERRLIIMGVFVLLGVIFLIRLFYIQVLNDTYKLSAQNNVLRHITQYPARGLIYDRNGELLVYNEAYYDLMVIPRQMKKVDTLALCQILEIDKDEFKERMKKIKAYSTFKPSVFEKQLSAANYALLQDKMFMFPGFFVQTRTLRRYPRHIGGHVLGYIGEVNQRDIDRDDYYTQGDYIGSSGLEKYYEEELRGKKGVKVVMVDVHNRVKGSFRGGDYDSSAIAGYNLISTLDANLQEYGEQLMQNKLGAIVAIEPATGEILAMINSPTYDPNLLVGRSRSKNYAMLNKDTLKPLFNRALMASQPPGSTFKLLNAIIGQQMGVVNESTRYSCHMGYNAGSFHMGCHSHASPQDLRGSVQHSCNAYYANVFRNILDKPGKKVAENYEDWRNYVMMFGLGNKLGVDLPNELGGNVPSVAFYDKHYGAGRWKSLTVVSLAIGQGELGVTPLQLANMTCAIANEGYYITPHMLKRIEGEPGTITGTRNEIPMPKEYFKIVKDGAEMVVKAGTGARSKIEGISLCGKTGTAQNPHGEDHSIFVAFAPKDDPKIAVAVFVENAGGGSKYAAPIASLMVEKYLNDTISRPAFEQQILEAELLSVKPKKKP